MLHEPRLNVCVVVPYDLSEPGGVKHHALELARSLRDLGDDVTILGPATVDPKLEGVVTVGGIVNVRSNGSDNRVAAFVSPVELYRFFHERRFDVLHIHEPTVPTLPIWAAWLTPGVPKVCTFHAYAESPSLGLRVGQQVSAFLQGGFMHRAIAVSAPAARHASRAWSRPLRIVPNGVATDVFTPGRPATRFPRDATRLLFIGRLSDPRKGLATMLLAYEALLARGVRVTLDVVGEAAGAPPPPPIEGLRYHGAVSRAELVKRYRECDVLVAPATSQESFGIVLLEAMATGKPIVCSDIEGYRSVIDPRGALVAPPRDAGALASAIEELAASPARRVMMGAVNLRHVQSYEWSRVAAAVRGEYVAAIEQVRGVPRLTPAAPRRELAPVVVTLPTAVAMAARASDATVEVEPPALATGS